MTAPGAGSEKTQGDQHYHRQEESGDRLTELPSEASAPAPPFLQLTLMSNGTELIETTRKQRMAKAVHYQTSKLSDWGSVDVHEKTRRISVAISSSGLTLESAPSLSRAARMNEKITRIPSISPDLNSGAICSEPEPSDFREHGRLIMPHVTNTRLTKDLDLDLHLDLTLLQPQDSNVIPTPSSLSRALGTPPVSYASLSSGVNNTPVISVMGPGIESQLTPIDLPLNGSSSFIYQPLTPFNSTEAFSERQVDADDVGHIFARSSLKWHNQPVDQETRRVKTSEEAVDNRTQAVFLTGPEFYLGRIHSTASPSASYEFCQSSLEQTFVGIPVPEQEWHKIPMYPLAYGCAAGSSEIDVPSGSFGIAHKSPVHNLSSSTLDVTSEYSPSDLFPPQDMRRPLQWHTKIPDAGGLGLEYNRQTIRSTKSGEQEVSIKYRLPESIPIPINLEAASEHRVKIHAQHINTR